PPSAAPNPYAAYGYAQPYQPPHPVAAAPQQGAQQQAAAHPQYPGYGYGGQTAQPAAPSPYQSYPSYAQQPAPAPAYSAAGAYTQPAQPSSLPNTPAGLPPNPYAAYGTPQNYAAAVAAANQQQQQAHGYPQYPSQPPAPSPYPQQPHYNGPPPVQQYPQQQQPAPYQGGPPPLGGAGPSPQGAPPFKRTRYDSMGAPQAPPPMSMGPQQPMGPPPALPPLNSGGAGGYNDRNIASRGRGGGSFGGPPPIRGGPNMNRGGYAGSPTHSSDGYGGQPYALQSPGGPANGAGRGGGSQRGGRGGGDMGRPAGPSFDARGAGPRAPIPLPLPPFPRGGAGTGPPPNAPFGPSAARANDRGSRNSRGAFDSRGRPVSGLPSGGRGGNAYGGRGAEYGGGRLSSNFDAPKGPRSATRQSSGRDSNSQGARKERKWGKDKDTVSTNGREEVKRTLTDFRISGLAIPELDWSWKTEAIQAVVQTIVDAAEDTEAPEPKNDAAEIDPTATEQHETESNATVELTSAEVAFDDSTLLADAAPSSPVADMSIDEINPVDLIEANSDVKPDIEAPMNVEVAEPKKKLSKKEKSKQVAAKRAATLAQAKALHEAAVATNEDAVKDEADESEASTAATMRKDGKHGRDDEEESLVITDIATKKVKADKGEVITLESLGLDKDGAEISRASKAENETTPAPQAVPTGPKALSVPTGPAADAGRTPPPPSNRENSRLRIYFASPVASASTHTTAVQLEKARSVKETSVAASVESKSGAKEGSQNDKTEAKLEPSSVETVKEEEEEDVDGVAFDSAAEGAEEVSQPVDESDDDSDAVQSALLDIKPQPGPASEADSNSAPVLPGENSSYPPNPYPSDLPPGSASATDGAVNSSVNAPSEQDAPELQPPEPSADRISISYARNTRRMVLDACVVDKVTIFRAEGRIELSVAILPAIISGDILDEFRICKGILVESLDPDNDDYVVIDRASLEVAWQQQQADSEEESVPDSLLPPLHHLCDPSPTPGDLLQGDGLKVIPSFNKSHVTIVAMLDRLNPLTEARWVKTGEVESWIASLNLTADKKDAGSEWKGKISISDPDPVSTMKPGLRSELTNPPSQPPTIQQALESWAISSTIGTLDERNGFVTGHLADIDNGALRLASIVFEILLRLTRGDRAGPSSHSPSAQQSSVGALAATLSAPYAEHQTQVSLAVLAMFRLSVETAAKAGIPQKEVEKQVGEIIRGIPFHLIFKSLDGMFREQRVVKKKKN
ncbi:hypothetical protein P7C70_g3918, partial [Phenoliferia sp. Uapishka_3]